MYRNSIIGQGKNNLASTCVEDIEFPIIIIKVLSTPNEVAQREF